MITSFKATLFKITFIAIFLFIYINAYTASITSTGSGDWNSNSTWSGGKPTNSGGIADGDVITIQAGHVIDFSSHVDLDDADVVIIVYGTIQFSTNGKKLRMSEDSYIELKTGGLLTSTNNNEGRKLGFGGDFVWTAKDTDGSINEVSGPGIIDKDYPATFNLLPVTLLSFSSSKHAEVDLIEWSTVDEKAFSHFEVERSLDGLRFEYIGQELSRGNALTGVHHYQFYDNPESQLAYYRLKMVDLDGTFDYSDVVVINQGGDCSFPYSLIQLPRVDFG